MPIKIIEETRNNICVIEMKEGQVAEIVSHDSIASCKGQIVLRYGQSLVPVGEPKVEKWVGMFNDPHSIGENFKVRILPPGTKFEIL